MEYIRKLFDYITKQVPNFQYIGAILSRKTKQAAGFDLVSAEDKTIKKNDEVEVLTAHKIAIPNGYFGLIAGRSGLAFKNSITTFMGIVDSDYRGTIGVLLFNHGAEDYHVKAGDRIAQLILIPYYLGPAIEVKELTDTERGSKGFGSTGK